MPIESFTQPIIIALFRFILPKRLYYGWGRSLVVRASQFKSEDREFDPLAGQDQTQCFCLAESTLVQTCLCLPPHTHTPLHAAPPSGVQHVPKCVCTLKIPYPCSVKEEASQPVVWTHENYAHRGWGVGGGELGCRTMAARFPRVNQPGLISSA